MKISIQLTAKDYLQARRLSMRPRPMLRYVGWVVIVLFVAFLFWQGFEVFARGGPQTDFWIILGVSAYLTALYFIVLPWRTRRHFREQKTLHFPVELELTDTHFMGSSTHGTFKIAWSDFHKWKRNEHLILVYQSSVLMNMIPLRDFPNADNIRELESILEKHLGPQKS